MTRKTKRQAQAAQESTFHNSLYRGEIGRTLAGSPVLKITPWDPQGLAGRSRQIAATIYELAAELEHRSEALQARWVVSPEPMSGRIVIELVRDEAAQVDQLLAELMADFHLA